MGLSHPLSHEFYQLNEDAALAALDGQRALLSDLAVMFREDSQALIDLLQTSIAAGERSEARRAAHSLKGLASTFFAQPTIDLAKRVEAVAGDESTPLSNLQEGPALPDLKRSVSELVQELEQAGYLSS